MLSKLFRKQPGGIIKQFDLSDWYMNLSPKQQSDIKKYFGMGMGANADWVDSGDGGTSGGAQAFLWGVGGNAVLHNDYEIAEIVLRKGLEAKDDNPTDRHFIYNYLIELYYKQRDTKPGALDECIKYCFEDIASIDDFLLAWHHFENSLNTPLEKRIIPRIPSFERMAIIYEKQGDIQKAVLICKRAIKLKLHDGTKGSFEGRLSRLERKLTSKSNSIESTAGKAVE